MKTRRRNAIAILATGALVSILVLLGLFWLRWLVGVWRSNLLPASAREIAVPLSAGQLEPGPTDDPNGTIPYLVHARMLPDYLYAFLGVLPYLQARPPGFGQRSHVYRWDPKPDGLCVYYDAARGQIIQQGIEEVRDEDGTRTFHRFTRYAGPQGIAETPQEELGRFMAPISDGCVLKPQVVYDRTLRKFFAIDWSERTVRQGPPLPDDERHRPVQIRNLWRSPQALDVGVRSASREESHKRSVVAQVLLLERVLVLDASGRIDLLDPQTLELVGVGGALPTPKTLVDVSRSRRLDDITAYTVLPLVRRASAADGEPSYAGLAAAALSREGLALRVEVYDPNGRRVATGDTAIPPHTGWPGGRTPSIPIPSAVAAYSLLPGAQFLTVAKFALESLHPPVLLLFSHLAGPHLTAAAGCRSLALLPDSFVAMAARRGDTRPAERILLALLYIVPAVFFALFLAWRVDRHGVHTGLPKKTRAAWRMGVLFLGLPAYFTYRLTRPQFALVTCANCGLQRRPDMEKCHRCGTAWVVPELIPPAWRVLGEPEPADERAPTQIPQANPQA